MCNHKLRYALSIFFTCAFKCTTIIRNVSVSHLKAPTSARKLHRTALLTLSPQQLSRLSAVPIMLQKVTEALEASVGGDTAESTMAGLQTQRALFRIPNLCLSCKHPTCSRATG